MSKTPMYWKVSMVLLVIALFFPLLAVGQLAPNLPRNETLIGSMESGRVVAPDNFNSWVGWKSRDRGSQQLMNESLWNINCATGKIINGLAAGAPVYSNNFTTLTINLRNNIAWSDGVPITADDVVYTIDLEVKTPGMNYHTAMVDNVKDAYAVGDHTVVIDLKRPNPHFHEYFLDRWGCLWIMPKHVFEKADNPLTFKFNPPVSSGPYKLYSYDPNGYWTIWVRRDDWDRTPTGILYGKPQPKYVVFQAFNNAASAVLAMARHELDEAMLDASSLNAILAQSKTVRTWQPTFPWVVNIEPAITGLTYNTAKFPYNISDVRWALTLAINIVEYDAIAVNGMGPLSPLLIPPLPAYVGTYFNPMEDWLENFTLDLGDGETFKPYDPQAPFKLADYMKSRGYVVPEDPKAIKAAFGTGWWKYAPDVAAKLLEKHGFFKDKNGKWHLPDGTLWKIRVLGHTSTVHIKSRNAIAAAQEWRKFGIDAEFFPSDAMNSLTVNGQFDVSGDWPAYEPWGAGPDLYRTLRDYDSKYVTPIGTPTSGHTSRWSDPRMDTVINKLEQTPPSDTQTIINLGIKGLKIGVEKMPGTPTFGYIGFQVWDTYYWSNWPSIENPYMEPSQHWNTFKYVLPFLKPTGKK